MKTKLMGGAAALAILMAGGAHAPALAQSAELGEWGIEIEHMSQEVAPGDDFFTYVNEGWLDAAVIPQGRSRIGAFTELRVRNEERIADVISSLGTGHEQGTMEQQISDLYGSFMDVEAMNDNFAVNVQGHLARIQSADSLSDIMTLMARPGYPGVFSSYVWIDDQDSTRYVFHLGQGGLSMPNREYYLTEGEEYDRYRAGLTDHMERLLQSVATPDARARAEEVMAFETALAEIHWTRVQERDVVAAYHLMSREELASYVPGLDWEVFFAAYGEASFDELVLTTDTSVQAIGELLRATPLQVLRDFITFQFLDTHADYLSTALGQSSFTFYSQTLNGIDEPLAREQRGVRLVNESLGEIVGEIYKDRYFPETHRAQVEEMVGYVHQALREALEENSWMDDETRERALYKWSTFEPRIGYPDRIRDYSDLVIEPDNALANQMRIYEWSRADAVSRLGDEIRDWYWGITPQTVNAFYRSNTNQIYFLAGILQPPFFDPSADPAVNFGAIGGVIGHEIGHGFDERGSQYDGDGNLTDWWSTASRAAYEERAQRIIDQYSQFEALEDLFVDGELTLGENLGDHIGILLALRGYQLYLEDHGEPPVLDGYTGMQRFFLSWSQQWRRIRTEDSMRVRVVQGPHSPAQFRVNGTLQNVDEWYDAFGVEEGEALYLSPEERTNLLR